MASIFCCSFRRSVVWPGNMPSLNVALMACRTCDCPRWVVSACLSTVHPGKVLSMAFCTPSALLASPSVITYLISRPSSAMSSPIFCPITLSENGSSLLTVAVQSGWPGHCMSKPLFRSHEPTQHNLFSMCKPIIFLSAVWCSIATPIAWDAFWPILCLLTIVLLL